MSTRDTQFGQVDPEEIANGEIDPENQSDIAEELAEEAGVDPSPQQVEQYLSLQSDDSALED
jgi:hypothetical protein